MRLDDLPSSPAQMMVKDAVELGRLEGLEGHARAAERRLLVGSSNGGGGGSSPKRRKK